MRYNLRDDHPDIEPMDDYGPVDRFLPMVVSLVLGIVIGIAIAGFLLRL